MRTEISLTPISFSVIAAHFLICVSLLFWTPLYEITPSRQKVHVQTVSLSPKPPVQKISPMIESPPVGIQSPPPNPVTPPPPAPDPPQPKPQPKVESTPPKPTPKPAVEVPKLNPKSKPKTATVKPKKATPSPTPAKKPATPVKEKAKPSAPPAATQKEKELLAKAQEKIRKMGSSRDKLAATTEVSQLSAPVWIEAIPSSSFEVLSDQESHYRDELAARLKLLLKLPEYGEVRVRLTLTRKGTVDKVEIVSSQNKANRDYIEKTLPSLKFSSFGAHFENASTYTFTLSLSNE